MFLVRYTIKGEEAKEDPNGEWCKMDFVTHLVNNLQQEIICLNAKIKILEGRKQNELHREGDSEP